MSASANVDLVRSIYEAWERGDYGSAEWAHPEIEYVVADGPSPGSWTGLAGMAEANRDVLSVWENVRQEAEDYRELDDERVLCFTASARAARRADSNSGTCAGRQRPCSTFAAAR